MRDTLLAAPLWNSSTSMSKSGDSVPSSVTVTPVKESSFAE